MSAGCERFYLVKSGNDCFDIALDAGISLTTFYSYNPGVGSSCGTLQAGYYVCIGISGPPVTITSGTPYGPTPSPIRKLNRYIIPSTFCLLLLFPALFLRLSSHYLPETGMVSSCVRFYYVESGNNCLEIALDAGISLTNFYSYNPAVGSGCGGLQAGVFVCIATSGPWTTITSGPPVSATGVS